MPTPVAALHRHGATWHQTKPLTRAGYTTAEQVAELVDGHRHTPNTSPLVAVGGMGERRVNAICEAVDRWTAEEPS